MKRQWGTYTKKVLAKMEWFMLRTPTEPNLFFFFSEVIYYSLFISFGPYIILSINFYKYFINPETKFGCTI